MRSPFRLRPSAAPPLFPGVVIALAVVACNTLAQPAPTTSPLQGVPPTAPPRQTHTPIPSASPEPEEGGAPPPAATSEPQAAPGSAFPWYEQVSPAEPYRNDVWPVEMGFFSPSAVRPPTRPPLTWEVGHVKRFTYYDTGLAEERLVRAVVRHVTPHAYLLFEEGVEVADAAIAAAAGKFENEIYPTTRAIFGQEWSPGIDADPHVVLLHMAQLGEGNWGEFNVGDECSPAVCDFSNGHEILYLSLGEVEIGSDDYLGTLAHELQHMIQFNVDANEANWMDEGLAQLAEVVNGYPGNASGAEEFLANPDLQLDHWPGVGADAYANYGAAYLFLLYLYERFGEGFIRDLSHHPLNSLAAVEAVLGHQQPALTLDKVFGEWAVANSLDDPALAEGQFGYPATDLPPLELAAGSPSGAAARHGVYPVEAAGDVHQYAADYIYLESLEGAGDLRLTFDGADQAALLPTSPHSGARFWWSNREEKSVASLQRTFDLAGLRRPRAMFWTWYDLEPEADVALVEVSDDGGRTWEIVPGRDTSRDPWWGHAFMGMSGVGRAAAWTQEEVSLRRWEGREIILRLQYITDSYHTGPGLALDDFQLVADDAWGVPQVVLEQDFETDEGGWEAGGFAYAQGTLAQTWAVYLIEQGPQPQVKRLSLDAENRGEIEVRLDQQVTSAVLVVAAMAPFTRETASYTYRIGP